MDDRPNVILLSADSLRADHLGCYGYHLPTSPNVDAMACEGVVFEKAFCPALPTQPSHTTIFTGQQPLTHGIVSHGGKAKLSREAPWLAELFVEAGYATATIDSLVRERTWFSRGYEFMLDPGVHHVYHGSVTQEELNDRAIQWIKTVPAGPFFLFIHYWDPHYPYTPPERYRGMFYSGGDPLDPENRGLDAWGTHPLASLARETWLRTPNGPVTDPNYVRALYDGEIRYFDDGVGHLLHSLEQLGLADNTILVLFGDHGESMAEHGIFFDHYGLYDSVLRVPLILRWPAGGLGRGLRILEMVQLSDVAPTVLDAAGLAIPSEMDGRSYIRQARGEVCDPEYRPVVGVECTWQAKYCLRTERYKLIVARQPDLLGNPRIELYDLDTDPAELKNIAQEEPELARALETELENWIESKLKQLGKDVDPVTQEGAIMLSCYLRGQK